MSFDFEKGCAVSLGSKADSPEGIAWSVTWSLSPVKHQERAAEVLLPFLKSGNSTGNLRKNQMDGGKEGVMGVGISPMTGFG